MLGQVCFIDDDEELRVTVLETLAWLGVDCVALSSVADLRAHEVEVLASRLAILDVNLGRDRESGIDAYSWLKSHGYHGKVVFLTGHARQNPDVEAASRLGDAEVLEKPISLDTLRELLADGASHVEAAP